MATTWQKVAGCDIGFMELNPDQTSSIILLHGAISSPADFGLVTPQLQDYHILIPAFHSNLKKDGQRPAFSISMACAQMATIIQQKAKHGRVHVCGFSMGGYIALSFAMQHPEMMLKLIVSGVSLSSRSSWWKKTALASVLYSQSLLPKYILPKQRHAQVLNWAMRPASRDFAQEYIDQIPNGDWALCKEIAEELSNALPVDKSLSIQARALIIAATASPGDSLDAARTIVKEINRTGGTARGIEIKNGTHPWILQLPDLFVEVLKTWIEADEVPASVAVIDTVQ